ncbi:MAG TPA: cytochrome c oxidase assembly protein [Porticoccaceae bacterium]
MPVTALAATMAALGLYTVSPLALAHSPLAGSGEERMAALLSGTLLTLFWLLYTLGSLRVRPGWRRQAAFHCASALCFLAVLGPLDQWAETSAAAHMVQHMLFMTVIAPLWVLAVPLPQFVAGGANVIGMQWTRALQLVRYPLVTAWLHGAVIWFWHLPDLYLLALHDPWWHSVEHVCFLLTAGLFWWAVLRSSAPGMPWALLAVLLTLVHTGFLGAMLTFAQAPLYGAERGLADQQLAGLIMWVPGAVPYLLAAAWLGHRWFRRMMVGREWA